MHSGSFTWTAYGRRWIGLGPGCGPTKGGSMGLLRNKEREPIGAAPQAARTGLAAVIGAVIAQLLVAQNPELAAVELFQEAIVGGTVVILTSLGNIARNVGNRVGNIF